MCEREREINLAASRLCHQQRANTHPCVCTTNDQFIKDLMEHIHQTVVSYVRCSLDDDDETALTPILKRDTFGVLS